MTDNWFIAIVLAKSLLYISTTLVAGERFHQLHTLSDSFYPSQPAAPGGLFTAIGTGLLSSVLLFLFTTGEMADDGFAGMLDGMMLNIMWTAAPGDALLFRLSGFLLALLTLLPLFSTPALNRLLFWLSTGCLSLSFIATGHIAGAPVWEKLALVFHISIAWWWFGALCPMLSMCKQQRAASLREGLENFGCQAGYLLPVLLFAGITMAITRFPDPATLYTTAYGQLFLLKVGIVAVILLIALRHKYISVPALSGSQHIQSFKTSLTAEIVVAISIFIATAILTSSASPA